jgi:hypothetical protein
MTEQGAYSVQGGCLCGAVRFALSAPPMNASYCHCTRCQRRTGTAASPNGRVAPGAFRVVRGEDRLRSWKPPDDGAEKFFCGDCGSAMFSRTSAGRVGVRFGVLDGDPGVRPSAHGFTAYAVSWEELPDDGLPRHPEGVPPR